MLYYPERGSITYLHYFLYNVEGVINLGKVKDLTGEVFGRLKVIKMTPERRNRQVVWECQCECGGTTIVSSISLISGNTSSCGCLKNHSIGEAEINRQLLNINCNFKR